MKIQSWLRAFVVLYRISIQYRTSVHPCFNYEMNLSQLDYIYMQRSQRHLDLSSHYITFFPEHIICIVHSVHSTLSLVDCCRPTLHSILLPEISIHDLHLYCDIFHLRLSLKFLPSPGSRMHSTDFYSLGFYVIFIKTHKELFSSIGFGSGDQKVITTAHLCLLLSEKSRV